MPSFPIITEETAAIETSGAETKPMFSFNIGMYNLVRLELMVFACNSDIDSSTWKLEYTFKKVSAIPTQVGVGLKNQQCDSELVGTDVTFALSWGNEIQVDVTGVINEDLKWIWHGILYVYKSL